ncbi:MAG: class II aldolase/adducin family protein [Deltaproteobacteria bacterium]|nr:class II aldolase/adducin family protein [Deltaproteobacteria bacterium]
MLHHDRQKIAEYGRRLLSDRLTTGTGGNLSLALRSEGLIAISPSGINYNDLTADAISLLDFNGRHRDGLKPSSEWHLHVELYNTRPEINAVVHTHSRFATTFALLHEPLPACHYLIGIAQAQVIRVAPYATFGTAELARKTTAALGRDRCILMANHGLLAVGADMPEAYDIALYIEEVAELYYRARCLGTPVLLNEEEMDQALLRFRDYGRNAGSNQATAPAKAETA